MFGSHQDLGAAMFKSWSEEQQREEIGKLVAGYRNGVPVGILCKMAETIAGSREKAREHLAHFLTMEEREQAVEKESGGMKVLVADYFL
ncbi:MAG: hypothetical protein FDZ69_05070 [Deltaproteobacteria bacterium]|nr:MAG: hypothetical protein FDZ69_05070 [Deltaproteobacteria bacterium]